MKLTNGRNKKVTNRKTAGGACAAESMDASGRSSQSRRSFSS